MIKKSSTSVAIGVAFVWFTTQFGGGFASGVQLFQYFVNFGIIALFTPVIAQAIIAFFQWYALKYAKENNTYDYRSFTDSFYGKYRNVFSNLYEILYIMLICLAPSVAFATGGSTLAALTGIPYILCTVVIGVFIFVLAVKGTDIVRKAASTISVLIIAGLFVVFVPNIIVQWSTIIESINMLKEGMLPVGVKTAGGIMPGLWRGFVYAAFQLASIGLFVQHAESFENKNDATKSMIYGFIVNAGIIFIATLGMMTIAFHPELPNVKVPTLLLVQNGVGAAWMMPVVSMLIILGAVSTGVNMIAAVVKRIVHGMENKESESTAKEKRTVRTYLVSLGFVLLTFAIAQFGLIPLVAVGYGYLGYTTIVVVMIPFIIHMLVNKGKNNTKEELNKKAENGTV
jgi:uncharacterized membrane protein YkvI